MNSINWMVVFCFAMAGSCFGQATNEQPPLPTASQITNSKTGAPLQLEQLAAQLVNYEVIFLGEQHDNDLGHKFQLDVIKSLVAQGVDVIVSMEQFERDVQGVVDDYLAGRISEDEFKKNSRPWKNYDNHYRPIIELAKRHKLPVLAGNVPRALALDVAMQRPIKLSNRVFLPRSTSAPENTYFQNFTATMKGHSGTEGAGKLKQFYAAQCLKDDAMAEAITDYLSKNPHRPKSVVHLCGHFHSDYGLGTAARVVQRLPLTRIAVITMETIPDEPGKDVFEQARARGHYVFWTVKNAPSSEGGG